MDKLLVSVVSCTLAQVLLFCKEEEIPAPTDFHSRLQCPWRMELEELGDFML